MWIKTFLFNYKTYLYEIKVGFHGFFLNLLKLYLSLPISQACLIFCWLPTEENGIYIYIYIFFFFSSYFLFQELRKRERDSNYVPAGAAKQEIDSTGEIQRIPKDSLGFDILLLRVQFVVIRNRRFLSAKSKYSAMACES